MLNDDEVWRDIDEFVGLYQVSSHGRVRATGLLHKTRRHAIMRQNPTTTSAYMYVKLWRANVMYNRSVHRLVAKAFVPNPDNKPVVNHLDGDKANNTPSNLEWVTHSENHKHAFRTGLRNADHVAARNRGRKAGQSSKYHNVSWDGARNKWSVSIKDGGRKIAGKRFDHEVEAARYVNEVLDKYGLHDRPRNII